jgi:hypothetical protein
MPYPPMLKPAGLPDPLTLKSEPLPDPPMLNSEPFPLPLKSSIADDGVNHSGSGTGRGGEPIHKSVDLAL